jgi:large subunit ribosomal protein L28
VRGVVRQESQIVAKVDAGVTYMPRVCQFTGKHVVTGNSISRRGKAKHLGGVGKKITGITRRKFKPNLQRVRAVVDGRVCRVRVSVKAIRMGMVVKPLKRNYQAAVKETSQSPAKEV